jgi:hypothetical protein
MLFGGVRMKKYWSIDITADGTSLSIGHDWLSGSPSEDIDDKKETFLAAIEHVKGFLGGNYNTSKEQIVTVLRAVTDYAAQNTCLHEETYRGGSIWEICSMCGAKWADDEGGKPQDAHELPKCIVDAYELLGEMCDE